MKITPSILLVAVTVALAGCNEADTSHPPKTVSWFFEHRDELAVTLKACRDNPGELATTPKCVNANEARNKVTVQEMKDALK